MLLVLLLRCFDLNFGRHGLVLNGLRSTIYDKSPKLKRSAHAVKHPAPAGLIKEMNQDMQQGADSFRQGSRLGAPLRGCKRPIDEQRPPHDVMAGDKPTVA